MKRKETSRWRREQEERKKHQNLRMIKPILMVIFSILLLGIGWQIFAAFRHSLWDGQNRINLVLNIDPISIVSFDPDSQTINSLLIPNGTYIETAREHGPYRIEKIYSLGELEEGGMELLSASLETYFGLPIDGWIAADEGWKKPEGTKSFLSGLVILAFKDKSLTNLGRWDLVRLWLIVNQTRGHKIETVNLGETTVAEKFALPDGTQASKIDQQRISRIISRLFTDQRICQENLAIAIMNAGTETGLAAKAARLIINIGGRLIEIGDWPEELENCQVKTVKKNYTSKKLSQVFGCQETTDLEKGAKWDLLIILTGENW